MSLKWMDILNSPSPAVAQCQVNPIAVICGAFTTAAPTKGSRAGLHLPAMAGAHPNPGPLFSARDRFTAAGRRESELTPVKMPEHDQT
jgi:hypothetical protein